jgi:serine/threonine-protein kinase
MNEDPRIRQLIDELLASRATPEEVCKSCPELLSEVRDRWQQMHRLEAELDALFPPPGEPFPPPEEPDQSKTPDRGGN